MTKKRDIEINMGTAYFFGILACVIVGLVVYLFFLLIEWALT